MLTGNVLENHTACGDAEAEELLTRILSEIGEQLSDTGLSVYLGGSYGRGEGGVREDRQNGILYNDLDFFVFSRNSVPRAGELLHEISEKYEKELNVDIDFSRVMSVQDIRKNAQRLMMQELKRGYRLVCGEDLLTEFLPEINAGDLLFSEACRLLLNRGMGLLLAGEKISSGSADTDFILRNLCKAVLGSGDAVLISEGGIAGRSGNVWLWSWNQIFQKNGNGFMRMLLSSNVPLTGKNHLILMFSGRTSGIFTEVPCCAVPEPEKSPDFRMRFMRSSSEVVSFL